MKYEFLGTLNPAQIVARATYRKISDAAAEWFRDLGGVSNLPAEFDVSGEDWVEAEKQIDDAAKDGDTGKTTELCARYERRALAYFGAWLKKLKQQKGALA